MVNPVRGSGFSNQNLSPFFSSLNCKPTIQANVGPTSIPLRFLSVNAPVKRSMSIGDLQWFMENTLAVGRYNLIRLIAYFIIC